MLNRIWGSLFLIASLIYISGCDQASSIADDPISDLPGEIVISEDLSREMWSSPEHEAILSLQKEFIAHVGDAFDRGVTVEDFTRAAKQGAVSGEDPVLNLIFEESNTKSAEFMLRFQSANIALIERYPILLEVQAVIEQEGCSIDKDTSDLTTKFFENFQAVKEFSDEVNLASKSSDVPVCGSYWNQVKLLACSAACGASTVGIGAGLCGWACWCWFCDEESALAEVIC